MDSSNPIGIIDTGIGGLKLASELSYSLPNEHFIYLGDNARFPYGSRKPSQIIDYGLELAEFLVNRRAKAIVLACGTLSAYALEPIAQEFPLPTFGTIKPMVRELNNKPDIPTAIWATPATIESNSFPKEIHNNRKKPSYHGKPNLAFQVENNQQYSLLGQNGIVVLGCTHYSWVDLPLNIIKVEGRQELLKEVKARLKDEGLLSKTKSKQSVFYFTGRLTNAKRKLTTLCPNGFNIRSISLKEEQEDVFNHR